MISLKRNKQNSVFDGHFIAGESISAGAAVYMAEDTVSGQTAGLIYNCDYTIADKSINSNFIGIALNSVSSGKEVIVRMRGITPSVFSGLTAGKNYYATSSGSIANSLTTYNSFLVGIAISANQLVLNNTNSSTAISSLDSAYFAGGQSSGGAASNSKVEKLSFYNSTNLGVIASAALSNVTYGAVSLSFLNTSNGYVLGGVNSQPAQSLNSNCNKINYTSDTTTANTSVTLSTATTFLGGVSDNTDGKGYVAGGTTEISGYTAVTTCSMFTYSSNVLSSSTTANLSVPKFAMSSLSYNTGGKGYFLGGISSGNTSYITNTDKLVYSTSTTSAQTSANTSVVRGYASAVSNDAGGNGFNGGGATYGSSYLSSIDQTTYSSDTTFVQTAISLSQARIGLTSSSDNIKGNGYFIGGVTGASVSVATADVLVYSTTTISAQTSANSSVVAAYQAGLSTNSV